MKPLLTFVASSLFLLLASCAAERPAPAPVPPAPVRPVAPRPAPPIAVPPKLGWEDQPLSPGSWELRGEGAAAEATFGSASATLILRCDQPQRQVQLLRPGLTTGNTMTVRTSDAQRSLPISISRDGSATPYGAVAVDDALLDSLVFSRGRFSVEVPGLEPVIAPSWPETARVVEDCRG